MGSGAGGGCGVGAGLPGMWPDLSPGVHTFWLNDLGKLLTPVQPRTPLVSVSPVGPLPGVGRTMGAEARTALHI